MNYFYTDANGQKTPVTEQQLQALINRGIITPETPLETDTGHTGLAGQIPGLNFNTAAPPPLGQPTQATPKVSNRTHSPQDVGSIAMWIKSWLLDFAFRDLRLPVINLWACRIFYAICCIAATVIFPIWAIISIVRDISEVPAALLIVILLTVICAVPFIFAARLACELYIIVFDWIVETTKAARKYNDE